LSVPGRAFDSSAPVVSTNGNTGTIYIGVHFLIAAEISLRRHWQFRPEATMISNLLMAALTAGCLMLWFRLSRANETIVALQTELEKLRLRLRKVRT
jgi:hypothetical protein